MGNFDSSKDKTLGEFNCDALQISVKQYGEGDKKLQIGPRVTKGQDGSDDKYAKAGRLSIKEVEHLAEKLPAILEVIKEA